MLTSSYPKYAGETTAPFIEEIAAGLARRGHTVHVVAPYHRDVARAPVERGVHLHFFRYSPCRALNVWGYAEALRADVGLRGRALAAAPLALGAALLTLLRLTADDQRCTIADSRLEVAHRPSPALHNDNGPALRRRAEQALSNGEGSIAWPEPCPDPGSGARRGRGMRRVHRPSSFDIIHAHWVLPNGLPAALIAWLRNLPLVISLHGSDVYLAERAVPLTLAAAVALRAAQAVTACSSDLQERALRLGARPTGVEVIPYGVDPQAFQPDPQAGAQVRAELGLAADTLLIVAISRLVYKKGLSYLLEAFPAIRARHPNAVLVIGGYGDLREELERRAQQLGIAASVRFPGQLARDRVARYISAADVYVVPSIRDQRGNVDGLPNVLLESMGAARPIVASSVAGIPEVILDGEHGLLVPERDPAALAAAITRLLDDRSLARQLGAAARRRVLEELTWDATAERFEEVYHRALQKMAYVKHHV
jgi:glycosyltransferase involved in cell wall biosynthesis